MLTGKEGDFLVKMARKIAEDYVNGKKGNYDFSEKCFSEKMGVFTTIEKYPGRELRGCIGFPLPHFKLGMALAESAKSACIDPRFPKLSKVELKKIVFEVSVLSSPEEIKFSSHDELMKKITPKKDGLILESGVNSGLFLPQVWEKLPDKKDFLDNLSMKAGLPPGSWKIPGVKISKFNAQIFSEESPRGKIKEIKE